MKLILNILPIGSISYGAEEKPKVKSTVWIRKREGRAESTKYGYRSH